MSITNHQQLPIKFKAFKLLKTRESVLAYLEFLDTEVDMNSPETLGKFNRLFNRWFDNDEVDLLNKDGTKFFTKFDSCMVEYEGVDGIWPIDEKLLNLIHTDSQQ